MKSLLIFTLGSFLAMQAPDAARPFPNHEQPPEGWHCRPAWNAKEVQTDPHACDCRGMNGPEEYEDPEPHCKVQGTDDDGNPLVDDKGQPVMVDRGESPKCKVFCHKSACTCAQRCDS